MRKEIQDYEDEKSKKLRRAQGKEEESSSTGSGSTDSEDDDVPTHQQFHQSNLFYGQRVTLTSFPLCEVTFSCNTLQA